MKRKIEEISVSREEESFGSIYSLAKNLLEQKEKNSVPKQQDMNSVLQSFLVLKSAGFNESISSHESLLEALSRHQIFEKPCRSQGSQRSTFSRHERG